MPNNMGYEGKVSYVKDEWGDNDVSKQQNDLIEVGKAENEVDSVTNDTNGLLYHDSKLHSTKFTMKYGHANGIGKRDGKSSDLALVID